MEAAKVTNTLTHAMKDIRDVSEQKMGQAKEQVARVTKEAGQEVDKMVHRSPWYFIGGTALAAAALGFYAGTKLK
jgi:ElaB/YqjD/DUF883 family membrane-anchored ribosome-binding protein